VSTALDHLVGHTDHRPLSPVEAETLRAGIRHLVDTATATDQRLRKVQGVLDRRTDRARTAETRIALALAVLDGHQPDSDEARQLAHEIRGALTMTAEAAR
jgi:hypothetical protein